MIRTVRGTIKWLDDRGWVIRLDNEETYKLPEWPEWIALGQRVRVTYDDKNGGRYVSAIGKA